jgi:son of sevenless-like protein
MMTGDRSMELPLESPVSATETGPRDRTNFNIPDKTRPPPEMLARGLIQDEDDDSATSASEAEAESLMFSSRGYTVWTHGTFPDAFASDSAYTH